MSKSLSVRVVGLLVFGFLFLSLERAEAYPTSYRRLILRDANSIVKIVDLYGDAHSNEAMDTHDAEKEKSDENFLQMIGYLGRKQVGHYVTMLGESSEELRDLIRREGLTSKQPTAMDVMIGTFTEKYSKENQRRLGQKVIYRDSDTFRGVEGQKDAYSNCALLDEGSRLNQAFRNLKGNEKVSAKIVLQVERFLQKFKSETLEPFCKRKMAIDPVLVILGVMDAELLINVFSSEGFHVVIYAGNMHIQNVAQVLVSEFSFDQVGPVYGTDLSREDFITQMIEEMIPGGLDLGPNPSSGQVTEKLIQLLHSNRPSEEELAKAPEAMRTLLEAFIGPSPSEKQKESPRIQDHPSVDLISAFHEGLKFPETKGVFDQFFEFHRPLNANEIYLMLDSYENDYEILRKQVMRKLTERK